MTRQGISFDKGLTLLAMRTMIFHLSLVLDAQCYLLEHTHQCFIERLCLLFPFCIAGRAPGRFLAEKPASLQITHPGRQREKVEIWPCREFFKSCRPLTSKVSVSIDAHGA